MRGAALRRAARAFCSSLSSELNASAETVRAYRADVSDYLQLVRAGMGLPRWRQPIVTYDVILPISIKLVTRAARRTAT